MYPAIYLLFAILFLANTTDGKTVHGHLYCPCSPGNLTLISNSSGAYILLKEKLAALDKILSTAYSIGFSRLKESREIFQDCETKFSRKECMNADALIRRPISGIRTSLCTYDSKSQKNLDPKWNKVPECSDNSKTVVKKTVNEGCVAVEHLAGLKLQYKRDFRANVLCSSDLRGATNSETNWKFCATPNHGIFVHGSYKSMKMFCAEESSSCTAEVRLVNNMRVFVHNRAHVNEHVIVTPYDARFPWWTTYIVQGIQEVFWMMYLSVGIFLAIVISWALHHAIMSD